MSTLDTAALWYGRLALSCLAVMLMTYGALAIAQGLGRLWCQHRQRRKRRPRALRPWSPEPVGLGPRIVRRSPSRRITLEQFPEPDRRLIEELLARIR